MDDLRRAGKHPVAALAGLIPQLTAALERHGFVPEAAGRDWAHWISQEDEKVVVRAYAFASEGGGVSLTITGASMPAYVERDLHAVIEATGSS
jgi:hypothetical protein